MTYYIFNATNTETYTLQFDSNADCRHWIINHLDSSLAWAYKEVAGK